MSSVLRLQELRGKTLHAHAIRPLNADVYLVSGIIAVSLLKADSLGLPFGCWTLDRLAVYLTAERVLTIKRSRINELLVAEGLGWRTDKTWFGDRVDPQFAEQRGPSSPSTRPHHQPV